MGKIVTVGKFVDQPFQLESLNSSESIIRFTLTKGKSSKHRSLNLPTVAIYLLELEVDNLFWYFTFSPKQHAISFEGKFPIFREFKYFGEFSIKRTTGGEKVSLSFLAFYLSNNQTRKKKFQEAKTEEIIWGAF